MVTSLIALWEYLGAVYVTNISAPNSLTLSVMQIKLWSDSRLGELSSLINKEEEPIICPIVVLLSSFT